MRGNRFPQTYAHFVALGLGLQQVATLCQADAAQYARAVDKYGTLISLQQWYVHARPKPFSYRCADFVN